MATVKTAKLEVSYEGFRTVMPMARGFGATRFRSNPERHFGNAVTLAIDGGPVTGSMRAAPAVCERLCRGGCWEAYLMNLKGSDRHLLPIAYNRNVEVII